MNLLLRMLVSKVTFSHSVNEPLGVTLLFKTLVTVLVAVRSSTMSLNARRGALVFALAHIHQPSIAPALSAKGHTPPGHATAYGVGDGRSPRAYRVVGHADGFGFAAGVSVLVTAP
jgi:hypothetical protein